ncbi:hypothetical protein X970_11190 [Pseudomonas monteilii SB3101]|uniref:Acyltransferase 3 domain-containing protein n=1 Tax=Pseudomonas monteilii SB3101 TaxID=1435058 RepID=V9V6D1_9PSED|nr:hypothetical protein X969_11535 [Pseudomonas monteilii SB3078]AHC91099.1 hypothetical protein X970_11190 [Pseudomonas monteilii SB3101]
MGLLRFVLAALVVVSHMGYTVNGYNPGVWAVVVFYLLAGHVVARLWSQRPHEEILDSVLWFYKDRALRIFPLYFTALLFGVSVWLLGANSYFLSGAPDLLRWVSNITVIPLSYYMWSGVDKFMVLPPAWSLGVELQFYLLVPLLLISHRSAFVVSSISVAVFAAAQVGWLNTDVFGYRLLVGVLFIFLTGAVIESGSKAARYMVFVACIAMFLYVLALWGFGLRRYYDAEVAAGYVVGVPLVAMLSKFKFSGRLNVAQRHAGNVSYGLFLFHFPLIWLSEMIAVPSTLKVLFVITFSVILAAVCHYQIERPFWKRFRSFLTPSPSASS